MKSLRNLFVQHRLLRATPALVIVLVLAFAVPLAIAMIASDEGKSLQTVKVVRQNGTSTTNSALPTESRVLDATPDPGPNGREGAQCLAFDLGGARKAEASGPVGEWLRCIAFCAKICGNSQTTTPRKCYEDCKADYCDKLEP